MPGIRIPHGMLYIVPVTYDVCGMNIVHYPYPRTRGTSAMPMPGTLGGCRYYPNDGVSNDPFTFSSRPDVST